MPESGTYGSVGSPAGNRRADPAVGIWVRVQAVIQPCLNRRSTLTGRDRRNHAVIQVPQEPNDSNDLTEEPCHENKSIYGPSPARRLHFDRATRGAYHANHVDRLVR